MGADFSTHSHLSQEWQPMISLPAPPANIPVQVSTGLEFHVPIESMGQHLLLCELYIQLYKGLLPSHHGPAEG